MQADGYSLDDKRSPVAENDIPDIIARFRSTQSLPLEGKVRKVAAMPQLATDEVEYDETARKRTEKSFFVPKDEIVENDYDLSINKYKKTEYKPVEYPPTSEIMAELRKIESEIATSMDELDNLLKQ